MSAEETELARLTWADATERVNRCREKLQKATDAGCDDVVIDTLQLQLDAAIAKAEGAYTEYARQMATWISDAPKRWDVVLAASTANIDGGALPAIAFGFRGGTESPVTVALIMTELGWRKFQKELDHAITNAVRESRKGSE
jgi:hypothetical protein